MKPQELIWTGRIESGDWTQGVGRVSVAIDDGRRRFPVLTPYGISHAAPVGSKVVGVRPDGTPEGGQGLVTYHEPSRVKVLRDGEVAINTNLDNPDLPHDFADHRITLTNNREVIVSTTGDVFLRSGETLLRMKPDGSIVARGNLSLEGNLNVTGRIVSDTEVQAGSVRLSPHTHGGDSGGSTTGPR